MFKAFGAIRVAYCWVFTLMLSLPTSATFAASLFWIEIEPWAGKPIGRAAVASSLQEARGRFKEHEAVVRCGPTSDWCSSRELKLACEKRGWLGWVKPRPSMADQVRLSSLNPSLNPGDHVALTKKINRESAPRMIGACEAPDLETLTSSLYKLCRASGGAYEQCQMMVAFLDDGKGDHSHPIERPSNYTEGIYQWKGPDEVLFICVDEDGKRAPFNPCRDRGEPSSGAGVQQQPPVGGSEVPNAPGRRGDPNRAVQ